jgi:hypothetical protein
MLDEIHGAWWAVYIGGPRRSPASVGWTPALVRQYAAKGIAGFLLTYVGRQVLLDRPRPIDDTHLLTKAQGRNDGNDACQVAADFGHGARGTPICLDLEGETFQRSRQRSVDYIRGWCDAVRDRGLRPGVYSNIPALIALRDGGPDWIWVAKWITNKVDPDADPHRIPDLDNNVFPNAGQRAWQYAGKTHDGPASVGGLEVDISVADSSCLAKTPGAALGAVLEVDVTKEELEQVIDTKLSPGFDKAFDWANQLNEVRQNVEAIKRDVAEIKSRQT